MRVCFDAEWLRKLSLTLLRYSVPEVADRGWFRSKAEGVCDSTHVIAGHIIAKRDVEE